MSMTQPETDIRQPSPEPQEGTKQHDRAEFYKRHLNVGAINPSDTKTLEERVYADFADTHARSDFHAKVSNAGDIEFAKVFREGGSFDDLQSDLVGELASFSPSYLAWGRVALHALIITATFAAIIMGATWPALLAGAGFTWMVNAND